MMFSPIRAAAAAVLVGVVALTGCTAKADPGAASKAPTSPSPSPVPTANADTWPTFTDERTGVTFQMPDRPIVYNYSGFTNDGMSQVGATYLARYESPRTNVATTIDLTAYTDLESKSADGKTLLAGFVQARKNEGDTQVKLTDVSTAHVEGFEATYGTLSYTSATVSHHVQREVVHIAGDGWGLIIEVTHDAYSGHNTKAIGRALRSELVEVLSYVDFTGASGGGGATT